MDFTKTFCKPGSCVTAVPAGLQLVLEYNEHGLFNKFYIGWNSDLKISSEKELDDQTYADLFYKIKDFVPATISTKGGTTWIYGVLYSTVIPCDDGNIPNCLIDSYIKMILENGRFTFYGGYVTSLAVSFQGPLIIQNFLKVSKFNPMPQVIVPLNLTDDTIDAMTHYGKVSFDRDYIAGFFVFEELSCRYASMDLVQLTVAKEPTLWIDQAGFWKGTIESASGVQAGFNYSVILHYGIEKGTTVLLQNMDTDPEVITTRMGSSARIIPLQANEDVKCPICKKICKLGAFENPFKCDDPHCMSHEYPAVRHMLNCFKMSEMSYYGQYKDLLDSKSLLCVTDVFTLPQYKDAEITTTLANLLYAMMGTQVRYEVLERFANKCSNKVETLKYYLNNPLRIETDLDVVDNEVVKVVKWLEDPYNVTTITTMLDIVKVAESEKKFDGDPIFRGNRFVLTGLFKRGDIKEVESILRSYAAQVSTSIELGDQLPNAVIIGGMNEGISGQVIQKAKIHHIPVIDEDDFFERYQIDRDMRENLL